MKESSLVYLFQFNPFLLPQDPLATTTTTIAGIDVANMPRVTRRSAAAAKSSSMSEVKTTTKKAVLVEDGDTARIDSTVASQTAKPEPQFFETFDTAANLSDGLCVIRKRDDGRYEMMSLNSTAHEDIAFGSMDFSRLVRDDQSGERLKMLEDVAKTWKGAEFRVGQALDSASKLLSPFQTKCSLVTPRIGY